VPPNDPSALAARMTALWEDPELRRSEGDDLIARARAQHSEENYVERLLAMYAGADTR
jgi:glycosyltransferase involved in cell wall biosynthesis